MARRTRFAAPFVVVIGCGHPAPPAPETPAPRDASVVPMDGTAVAPHANPPGMHAPIDARVIQKTVREGKVAFVVGIPIEVEQDLVTIEWSGVFIVDGKPIAGTDFKLLQAKSRIIHGELSATELPSESVRLFPPYYPRR